MYATFALALVALCGHSEASSLRIVGGRRADPENYPFAARIVSRKNICSGTIISQRFVLTAWHCVAVNSDVPSRGVRPAKNFEVRYNVKNHCEGQYDSVGVEEIITYGDYPSLNDDIALLRLTSAPNILSTPSVELPSKLTRRYLRPHLRGVAIGFGRDRQLVVQHLPCYLKELGQEVAVAQDQFSNTFNSKTRDGNPWWNICDADSGGPWLFNQSRAGKDSYILYGVLSTGQGGEQCIPSDDDEYGATYVDVYQYIEWIEEHTGGGY